MNKVAEFCRHAYAKRYGEHVEFLTNKAQKGNPGKKLSDAAVENIEKAAQKEALWGIALFFLRGYAGIRMKCKS